MVDIEKIKPDVFNPNTPGITQLLSRKFAFLHAKRYGLKNYSTFQVSTKKQLKFQEGDGDVFFT